MNADEAIAILDGLSEDDGFHQAHHTADDVLCAMVPEDVAAAFKRAAERVGFCYS